MEYLIKATEGFKPYVAFIISLVMYVVFPDQAFLTAFYAVLGAMLLDIITKYIAISSNNGGFRKAIKTKKIYSKSLWDGTKIKIISYAAVFILAGLSYRVAPLTQVSIFLATVIYSIVFLKEAQSIIENLIEAGADLKWLLIFVKKKQNQVLKSETDQHGKNNNDSDLGCLNKITKKISSNKFNGRYEHKPDMIVCHITEGSYQSAVNWLCNPSSQVSAHFVVAKDSRITQLVDLKDGAWCNGTSTNSTKDGYYGNSSLKKVRDRKTNANYYTISIEFEGFYKEDKGKLTEIQKRTGIELIKHIRSEVKKMYGIDIPIDREHIVGHYQVTPITKPNCPGQNFQFDAVINELKKTKNVSKKKHGYK